ncbi:MAG: hypothetical protein WAZ19_11145 [Anaerolineae bacterium]
MSILAGLSLEEKLAVKRGLAEQVARAGLPLPTASTPGALAAACDGGRTVERPHTRAMDQELTALLGRENGRLMIETPPQVGKSSRASRAFPFWWLTNRPGDAILLASFAASLAQTHGAAVREMVRTYGVDYGLRLTPTQSTKAAWALTAGGSLRSVGVRGGLSGHPMDLGIIDDPFAGRAEADSPTMRKAVWDWYSSVWSARRSPTAREVIVMCMTGDTPVLMADGTEKPLRDVRPGDEIATYDNGALSTSVVRNWANQGTDQILEVRMKSGRIVRANERHPFRVINEKGEGVWVRLGSLRAGMRVRCHEAPGKAFSVQQTDATGQPDARACACRTTANSGTQTGTVRRPLATPVDAKFDSKADTGSHPRNTIGDSPSRADGVRSVEVYPMRSPGRGTGPRCSVSTTITTPGGSAGCFATTAISLSDAHTLPTFSAPPLTTWTIRADEVTEIVPAGREDVYDIEVDRTHNFIANGLEVSNTRWHQDDLVGRLLDRDGRVEEGGEWVVLHMPALALAEDRDRGIWADPLGRAAGEPLPHPRITEGDVAELAAHWARQRTRSTERDWNALYQGVPFSVAGALLSEDDVRAATADAPAQFKRVAVGVDPAGGGRDTVGIVTVGLDSRRRAWFLDDATAKMSAAEWPQAVCRVAHAQDADRIVVEKNFGGDMGKQLIAQAWEHLARDNVVVGLCPLVVEVTARRSKVLRAEPVAQAIKTGRCFFARGGSLKQVATEFQMWEPGSTWSPGALDAGVHAVTDLMPAVPRGGEIANPASRRRDGATPRGGLASKRRTA